MTAETERPERCPHERLNEDGSCRNCGVDMRSGKDLTPGHSPVSEAKPPADLNDLDWSDIFLRRQKFIREWGNRNGFPNMGDALLDGFLRFWAELSWTDLAPKILAEQPPAAGSGT